MEDLRCLKDGGRQGGLRLIQIGCQLKIESTVEVNQTVVLSVLNF